MTLVDTSVWIEHLRRSDPEMELLLGSDRVLTHPFVLGELSLGQWKDRTGLFHKLGALARAPVAADAEVLALIERHRLWGRGLSWVDCHLLASARESHCHLLTRDKSLKSAWLMVRKH